MPRPANLSPPLRFHKASGQYYITLAGRKHYLGKAREPAEEKRRRLIAEHLLSSPTTPPVARAGTLSVAEACEQYLSHAKPKFPSVTYARVYRAIEAVIETHGSLPLHRFAAPQLEVVRVHLLNQRQRRTGKKRSLGAPLSRRYVNHLVKSIQQCWLWLESRGIAPEGRSAHLRTLKALREGEGGRETEMVLAVETWAVEATLPFCPPVVADMVRVQLQTGMRPGELVRMRPADMARTPEEKVPTPGGRTATGLVADGVPVWVYAPPKHKTRYRGKWRLVAIGPKAQEVLAPYFEGRKPDAPLFSPTESNERSLASRRKKPAVKKPRKRGSRQPGIGYTVSVYARSVNKAISRANRWRASQDPPLPLIPDWSPNQLRHAVGTAAEEIGGRATAQAVLGHASPDTTAIYAEQAISRAAAYAATNG